MERRAITVRGIVQGVGFRPFIHGLATRLGLVGFVNNRSGVLHIEIEGEPGLLEQFVSELVAKPPPLAHVQELTWQALQPLGDARFQIHSSEADCLGQIFISPDVATCAACLAELFDPCDRRYRYPFLNCTNCGPRLTIITGAPYDRPRTTMAGFAMCAACRAEYENPADRRFHAQPTACAMCGPTLKIIQSPAAGELWDGSGESRPTWRRPRRGPPSRSRSIYSWRHCARVKSGLSRDWGATTSSAMRNEDAVSLLRQRKHRDEKPFAVMVENLAAACALCEVAGGENALLQSPRRPIVLLRKRTLCPIAPNVAPGNPCLGLMLPYTPVHALLLRR